MRVHRARGGDVLRPSAARDGERDVSERSRDDDWAATDGEVFRQAEEPTGGVLFSVRPSACAVRMAVRGVVRGELRVRGAVFGVLSDGADIFKTRPGRGTDAAATRDKICYDHHPRQGTAIAGLRMKLVPHIELFNNSVDVLNRSSIVE